MASRFNRVKHEQRMFELFPRSDEYKSVVQAVKWYDTITDYRCHRAFTMKIPIKTLYKQQQDLIDVLSKGDKFLIVEELQLTRACRVAAMVMQVCVNVAAMKEKTPPVAMNEEEWENGMFCRPYVLMIFPDNDINPGILMDASTLAHHTWVNFSTPNICVDYPGDESLHLANAEIVFCSMPRLKQLVGQKAINLSGVQRIIIDEPLYFDEPGFEDFGMVLRHHEMNATVDTIFVGRSYTAFTKKKISDITVYNSPTFHTHTDETRKSSMDEWDAYAKSL